MACGGRGCGVEERVRAELSLPYKRPLPSDTRREGGVKLNCAAQTFGWSLPRFRRSPCSARSKTLLQDGRPWPVRPGKLRNFSALPRLYSAGRRSRRAACKYASVQLWVPVFSH